MKQLHISKVYYLVLSLFFALTLSASALAMTPEKIAEKTRNDLESLKGPVETTHQTSITKQKIDNVLDVKDMFTKSREKMEQTGGEPTPEEIKAKKIIEETKNMSDEEFLKYMKEHEAEIRGLLKKLDSVRSRFATGYYDRRADMYRRQNDGMDYSGNIKSLENKDSEAQKNRGRVEDVMVSLEQLLARRDQLLAQKSREKMAENGVTNYREIPNHSQLKALVKKMQMTFETDEDGLVGVYINGEYTNFDVLDPEYDESYKVFPDTKSVGIIFEIKSKDGRVYTAEFVLENGKVIKYGAWQGKELHKINEYELSANKEVSQR